MNILTDLIQNPVFLSAGGAWLVAQVSKILYESIRYGFRKERLKRMSLNLRLPHG